MKLSLESAVYCIENMGEHASLLCAISRGVCNLNKSLIPERFEEHFKPYIIESMEFEFVELQPPSRFMDRLGNEQLENKRKLLKNLKLGPVSNVFENKLKKLKIVVEDMMRTCEITYLFLFQKDWCKIVSKFGGEEAQFRSWITSVVVLMHV